MASNSRSSQQKIACAKSQSRSKRSSNWPSQGSFWISWFFGYWRLFRTQHVAIALRCQTESPVTPRHEWLLQSLVPRHEWLLLGENDSLEFLSVCTLNESHSGKFQWQHDFYASVGGAPEAYVVVVCVCVCNSVPPIFRRALKTKRWKLLCKHNVVFSCR